MHPDDQHRPSGYVCPVTSKDGTLSRSRSSGRGEEDNSEWRQAIERRQLASELQLKLSPGDRKIKRRKRDTTHPGFNIRASLSSAFKRPSSKFKARTRINISWDNRSYPRSVQREATEPHTPCLELSVRKAQTLLIF
ncbi:hypothetical protein CK203_018590 [Vitis vinifera]|uniref:Uncharacterized protein n=1 Tax=Vitis vinifera TaxID=29760 RepID=A0A438J655_VITVI|nr:hypothetical protein CK203_018590 [Vitis vinifera]